MNAIADLIRSDLSAFKAYSSARLEASEGDIWLNANELPWGDLNRYPRQQSSQLTDLMSQYYKVAPEQILITRGSDEGIDLLTRLFCQAYQDAVMICPPTFGMYEVSAKLQGAAVIKVPLMQNSFELNEKEILMQWQSNIKILFLCSPNNPTGNLISNDTIKNLCDTLSGKAIVVVDEAYIEFANRESATSILDQCQNLVILRTLSKAFGLAALRIGVLIANPELITWLSKILAPYPLPALSTKSALAALQAPRLLELKQHIDLITEEREQLRTELKQLKLVQRIWPSQANFLFAQFTHDIEKNLLNKGLVLRNMESRTGIKNAMRITIGTPTENKTLLTTLKQL